MSATQVVLKPASVQNIMRKKWAGTSVYRGVSKYEGKWRAQIRCDGPQEFLGYFDTEIDAAKAYDRRARVLHGPYAKLNFPGEN